MRSCDGNSRLLLLLLLRLLLFLRRRQRQQRRRRRSVIVHRRGAQNGKGLDDDLQACSFDCTGPAADLNPVDIIKQ